MTPSDFAITADGPIPDSTDATATRDDHYVDLYNGQAAGYDLRSFGSRAGAFSCRYKNTLIVDYLHKFGCLGQMSTLLDCPSGTGRVTHFLVNSPCECKRIVVCDISPKMLERNRRTLPPTSAVVTFHEANMKQLPLKSDSVTAACVASFLYLVPRSEYATYLSDIYRVLRPGGIAIVEVSNTFPAYNPRNIVRVVRERFIEKRAVKSYISPSEFCDTFRPFEVVEYAGSEFPLISNRYSVYRQLSRLLGKTPVLKWFSGKFTIVLRKPSPC